MSNLNYGLLVIYVVTFGLDTSLKVSRIECALLPSEIGWTYPLTVMEI